MTGNLRFIAEILPMWFEANARSLPWRENKDPYRVWLSEIMLQQTRVEAVVGYYNRFLSVLPDIPSLAVASQDVLLKLWEGLGYYNRVRNLQKAARKIMEEYQGAFPRSYEEILALPGVGAYTAGAVGSICFDLPTPAVDGNVLRVISRYLEDPRVIDLEQTKKAVREMLVPVYETVSPGIMTQALMELGACVCIPNGSPKCEICPLKQHCVSFAHQTWEEFPKRAEKKKRKIQHKMVLVLQCGEYFAIKKRSENGLLANLWEFPNVDIPEGIQADIIKNSTEAPPDPADAVRLADSLGVSTKEIIKALRYTHVFTHVEWHMTAWFLLCDKKTPDFIWVTKKELKQYFALPSAFRPFLEEILSDPEM